jgi:hypothetical protein
VPETAAAPMSGADEGPPSVTTILLSQDSYLFQGFLFNGERRGARPPTANEVETSERALLLRMRGCWRGDAVHMRIQVSLSEFDDSVIQTKVTQLKLELS